MDIATREEVGPREHQEDRCLAASSADGSWVIAAADGQGGRHGGQAAAITAIGTVPPRIASDAQMLAVFDAANASVAASDDCGLAAMAIAAWTPGGGLLFRWSGDCLPFVLPAEPHVAWRAPIPLCGQFAVGEFPSHESTRFSSRTERMPAPAQAMIENTVQRTGVVIVVCTDGLHVPLGYTRHEPGGWFDSAVPISARDNADHAAQALMDAAQHAGLVDNTAVAVAVLNSESLRRSALASAA